MLEFFYTLLMLVSFVGMFLYSRSIPVAFISLYITYWFLPQGIPIIGTDLGFVSILGICELVFFCYYYIVFLKPNEYNDVLMYESLYYIRDFILFLLLIAFMSTVIPFGQQISGLGRFFLYLLNTVIVASCFNERKEFICVFHFVILWIFLSGIYGIYTYIIQFNPFAELVVATQTLFEEQGMKSSFLEEERGFLHGRISGFTVHPLLYGGVLVLCFYLMMFYYQDVKSKWGKFLLYGVFFSCLVLIVLTGSRSILIGLICGLLYYFWRLYSQKLIKYALIASVFFFLFGLTIEDEYVRSILFFWEEHDEIQGSSSSMRVEQLEAAVDIISNDIQSLLFGFGRGWSAEYVLKYGNVKPFQGFEGFFISSFVEYGILGTIIYFFILFVPLYKICTNYVEDTQRKTLLKAFLISGFVIYSFTGVAYGLWLYVVLTFLLIKYTDYMNVPDDIECDEGLNNIDCPES